VAPTPISCARFGDVHVRTPRVPVAGPVAVAVIASTHAARVASTTAQASTSLAVAPALGGAAPRHRRPLRGSSAWDTRLVRRAPPKDANTPTQRCIDDRARHGSRPAASARLAQAAPNARRASPRRAAARPTQLAASATRLARGGLRATDARRVVRASPHGAGG